MVLTEIEKKGRIENIPSLKKNISWDRVFITILRLMRCMEF